MKNAWRVDASAAGADGHAVADLTAADFAVTASGAPQKVTAAEFHPPSALRMVFMVDDLSLSGANLAAVKDALLQFVNGPLPAGSEALLLRTSGGSGALAQFTGDAAVLRAAIGALTPRPAANDSPLRFGAGSMGALRSALLGLQYTPGRKVTVFFSERLRDANRTYDPLWVSRLTRVANQSAAVLYAVDVGSNADPARAQRLGLAEAAPATGGYFFDAAGDARAALARILGMEQGYYMVRFETDPMQHLAPLVVKTSRPGVAVRARAGVLGRALDGDAGGHLASPDQLSEGLMTLLAGTALRVAVTAQRGQDGLEAKIHVDADDIAFTLGIDGEYHAQVQEALAIFQENDRAVTQTAQGAEFHLTPEQYEAVRQSGFDYALRLPDLRTKGPYQLHAAVLDTTSGRMGTAAEFIEWDPALQLTISAIELESTSTNANVFPAGHPIQYAYQLTNLSSNAQNHALIEVSSLLTRDGTIIYTGKPQIVDAALTPQSNAARVSGRIKLGAAIGPGHFTLKITAIDTLSSEKPRRSVTQSVDFVIEP